MGIQPTSLQAQAEVPAGAAPGLLVIRPDDAYTRSGFEHFYNLEYDQAIRDFEQSLQDHPQDPFAVNHLLTAVLFKELYRIGALDTELYARNGFLSSKHLPVEPKARERMLALIDEALRLSEERLEQNPNDVDALYARGVTRGTRATYVGLVEKAWFSALRSAVAARKDHERVLELSPGYTDAKLIVGIHNYILASLPWSVKVAATLVGIRGNKAKGIEFLYEAGNAHGETTVDARIALSLFLRREQRYAEALAVVRSLTQEHPRNFLFALELANLLNAAGQGQQAIAAYRSLLHEIDDGQFKTSRPEQAYFGLGEALRGQREWHSAARAYDEVLACQSADPEILQRASLNAGEMYDALVERPLALERYHKVLNQQSDGPYADLARRYLKHPYQVGERQ